MELSRLELKSSNRGQTKNLFAFDMLWNFRSWSSKTPIGAARKFICIWHVLELLSLEFGNSNKGQMQENLCLAFSKFLKISWTHFFCVQPPMDPPRNLLKSSMKGWGKKCFFASHGTPELHAQGLHKRLSKKKCFPSLQLSLPKVGGRAVKFS